MTLTVETGEIIAGADSYCSLAYATAYHYARGNAQDWSDYNDVDLEHALRKATDYMLQKYGNRWMGYRKSSNQSLDWPRNYVPLNDLVALEYVSSTIVPNEVKNACAALAFRALTDNLLDDEEQVVIREKVDVIETEYSPHSTQRKRYPEIDLMLRKYLMAVDGLPMVRVG